MKSQAPVAVLRRNSITSDQKGTLACALPWGFGYGWNINNGIWGGGKQLLKPNLYIKVKFILCLFSAPCFSTNWQFCVFQFAFCANQFLKINLALTWSQADDALALHALPATHCTNMTEIGAHCGIVGGGGGYMGDYAASAPSSGTNGGYDWHNHYEDLTADDGDFAMDFGDFIF